MTKKYRSEAFVAIHETVEALSSVGAVDKRTLREFDEAYVKLVETYASTGTLDLSLKLRSNSKYNAASN